MSFEVFGGGDERDWFEVLSSRGWITDNDGETWRKFPDEEEFAMEEAIAAHEAWLEED